MKTLITTTISIAITMLSAKANHFSALNLKMFDNGMFSVVIDNQARLARNQMCSAQEAFSRELTN